MADLHVKPGDFPFPLVEGPEESRYLTWVRNHSNYMATRGFLDYVRIAAVLVRGILINFLTLLPYLLGIAVLISWLYAPLFMEWEAKFQDTKALFVISDTDTEGWMKWVQDHLGTKPPFLFTPLVALLTLIWFLLFPMVTRLYKVVTHRTSLETGRESSVKLRDRYERSFASAILVVASVAVLEFLPLLVHYFHHFPGRQAGWREVPAIFAAISSLLALSGAGTILSLFRKAIRPLVMLTIGGLGLFLPLLVMLYVTEYLVYTNTETFTLYRWMLGVVPVALAAGIILTLIVGRLTQSIKEYGWVLKLLIPVVALAVMMCAPLPFIPTGKWFLVLALAFEIWLFCWLAVDINLTSVHGLYRDRLASAYLVGVNSEGDVDIEEDIDLHGICQYENGSVAPYHLVNVALNLQSSPDMGIRERNSDFFIFSRKFIGSNRTQYCRSEAMEAVFPQMDLATAMAISAAAAAPNMGRNTNAVLVAVLTLFNVRLGYWIPNPGQLPPLRDGDDKQGKRSAPYTFGQVFQDELVELQKRWNQVYCGRLSGRSLSDIQRPTVAHGLVGLAFSGGGIRSATINLGIAQALHQRGVFDHVDYLSTVSGGGYLGSSLSTLMRKKRVVSEIEGIVQLGRVENGRQQITVVNDEDGDREYWVPTTLPLQVQEGAQVARGQAFASQIEDSVIRRSLKERFAWRVRPSALLREMRSRLDEVHDWVNLSDGGHIENLATMELLRRRCKFIILGDGEADPNLTFNGLATLMRYARLELGIQIDIDVNPIRWTTARWGTVSPSHFAVGRIHYPNDEHGYLLYLKSSFTGREDEVVTEYRSRNPAFPHESTADQFFDEGQFEAYRALGQHIGLEALEMHSGEERLSYADLEEWFQSGLGLQHEACWQVEVRT